MATEPSVRKRRLSLTKRQRGQGAGAALLNLLQEVTRDGAISDSEMDQLAAWLAEHQTADLPAIAHLAEAIERVLVDGAVTDDERDDVLDAIEAVLPLAERREAAARRDDFDRARAEPRHCATERCENLIAKNAPRNRKFCDACRESRRTRRPGSREASVLDVGFKVAGVSFEGRQEVIQRYVNDGDALVLRRAPDNPYDGNAVDSSLDGGSTARARSTRT